MTKHHIISSFEQALYSFFKDNPNIEVKNIYSYPPPNAVFPYIYLGGLSAEDRSTKSDILYHLTKQITIYSLDQSPLKLYNIADIIITNLRDSLKCKNHQINLLDKTNLRVKRIQVGEQNIFTATFTLKFLIGENYDDQ